MEINNLIKDLNSLKSAKYFFNQDISHLSTMRLKAFGHFLTIQDYNEIQSLVQIFIKNGIDYKIIGWGANQILKENSSEWVYVKLLPPEKNIFFDLNGDSFILPAGLGLNVLISEALKNGFIGWEVLTGIPGTVGGATFMNAGTKFGDISSIILSIEVVTQEGKEKKITNEKTCFSYRKNNFINYGDVITKVQIFHHGINKEKVTKNIQEYMDYRKRTQPLQSNNCGCVFKNMNGVSAGKIIDDLKLKGLTVGRLRVSTVHGNFIENIGGGTADEFWELVAKIQEKVKSAQGKEFELEICS